MIFDVIRKLALEKDIHVRGSLGLRAEALRRSGHEIRRRDHVAVRVIKRERGPKSNNGITFNWLNSFALLKIANPCGEHCVSRMDKTPQDAAGCAEPQRDCGHRLDREARSAFAGSL